LQFWFFLWNFLTLISKKQFLCNEKPYCTLVPRNFPALQQTGSRNLMGQKTLPMIWGTYIKLVTKYQISCWEKCAYMFNVYKNQLSRQTGSRNLTGPKTLRSVFEPIRFLLPVCQFCWFLYTFNITFVCAHFSSHFSKQLLMTGIWYLVTSFI
jgi:hypothetical protein